MGIVIIVAIIISAFGASLLTFFSGFGLGTILTPVFAIFFPVETAIAVTGIVHFSNNILKAFLVGKKADKPVLVKFGIPAILASFMGALLLLKLSSLPVFYQYQIGLQVHVITPLKLIIAVILIGFSLLEILPRKSGYIKGKRHLVVGGMLSGFFGGLSGLQGAIRGAFLINSGLTKEAYLGTAVLIALFVDGTRLTVYAGRFTNVGLSDNLQYILPAILSAMAGAILGKRLLPKVTFNYIRNLVAIMLIIISLALATGLI